MHHEGLDRRLGFGGGLPGCLLPRADRIDDAMAQARSSCRADPRPHRSSRLQAACLGRPGAIDELGDPFAMTAGVGRERGLRCAAGAGHQAESTDDRPVKGERVWGYLRGLIGSSPRP